MATTPQRAYTGLAGSPLAVIREPHPQVVKSPDQQPKRGRGRPRKYANDAERMKRNRAKEREEQKIAEVLTHNPEGLFLMGDAPHAKGLLITGGYDTDKISEVVGARDRDEGGRKVRPQGLGGVQDDGDEPRDSRAQQTESEDRFIRKQEKGFKKSSGVLPVARWKKVRMLCPVHPGDPTISIARWDKVMQKFVLTCGCHRDLDIQKGINEQPISEKGCS